MPKEGKQIGEYTLLEKLGTGGFGDVWKAEKRTILSTSYFAIKFFRPKDTEEVQIEKIKKEIAVSQKLSGLPYIVSIIEANQFEDYFYIVSEFADGGSLDDWLKNQPDRKANSIDEAVKITIEILKGLRRMHQFGFIHRDLKPANILGKKGHFCLADFGISREIKTHSKATATAGTYEYMPPEAFGKTPSISAETDIWSVGVILQQLLTGKLPFPQDEIPSLMAAIIMDEPEPMPEEIPPGLRGIVKKALQRERQDRFDSAEKMIDALNNPQKFLDEQNEQKTEKLTIVDKDFDGIIGEDLDKTEILEIEPTQDWRIIEAEKERQQAEQERIKKEAEAKEPRQHEKEEQEKAEKEAEPQRLRQEIEEKNRRGKKEKSQFKSPVFIILAIIISLTIVSIAIFSLNKSYNSLNTSSLNRNDKISNTNENSTSIFEKNKNLNTNSSSTIKSDFDVASECYDNENYDCAIKNFTKWIDSHSDDAIAYYNRGRAYNNKGKYDRAIADYDEAIRLKPDEADAYYNRGVSYDNKGKYDQAIENYTKAIELKLDNADVYNNRGVSYENKGEYDKAIADYRKALEIDPNDKLAKESLKIVLKKKKKS